MHNMSKSKSIPNFLDKQDGKLIPSTTTPISKPKYRASDLPNLRSPSSIGSQEISRPKYKSTTEGTVCPIRTYTLASVTACKSPTYYQKLKSTKDYIHSPIGKIPPRVPKQDTFMPKDLKKCRSPQPSHCGLPKLVTSVAPDEIASPISEWDKFVPPPPYPGED